MCGCMAGTAVLLIAARTTFLCCDLLFCAVFCRTYVAVFVYTLARTTFLCCDLLFRAVFCCTFVAVLVFFTLVRITLVLRAMLL